MSGFFFKVKPHGMNLRKTYFNSNQHCSNNKEIQENTVSIKGKCKETCMGKYYQETETNSPWENDMNSQ